MPSDSSTSAGAPDQRFPSPSAPCASTHSSSTVFATHVPAVPIKRNLQACSDDARKAAAASASAQDVDVIEEGEPLAGGKGKGKAPTEDSNTRKSLEIAGALAGKHVSTLTCAGEGGGPASQMLKQVICCQVCQTHCVPAA